MASAVRRLDIHGQSQELHFLALSLSLPFILGRFNWGGRCNQALCFTHCVPGAERRTGRAGAWPFWAVRSSSEFGELSFLYLTNYR